MRATAIVIALPLRISGASLFGKTVETLLAERPCRIVIESSSQDAGRRAAAALANSTRS